GIGVFHWQGHFYAYQNLCLHQGGPACEGVIMPKVEDVLGADKTWLGQKFSADEAHFVCPWHGYEYDLRTGECAANRKLRLKSYEVVRRDDPVFKQLALAGSKPNAKNARILNAMVGYQDMGGRIPSCGLC